MILFNIGAFLTLKHVRPEPLYVPIVIRPAYSGTSSISIKPAGATNINLFIYLALPFLKLKCSLPFFYTKLNLSYNFMIPFLLMYIRGSKNGKFGYSDMKALQYLNKYF